MSSYVRYANKKIITEDIEICVDSYIDKQMRKLYRYKNPLPKITTENDGFLAIGSLDTYNSVLVTNADDVAAMRIRNNLCRIKNTCFVVLVTSFLAIKYDLTIILFAVLYVIIFFDEILFRISYHKKRIKSYKKLEEIAKQESIDEVIGS